MIKLKNKEYPFKLGFKALLLFEEETGQSLTTLMENIKMGTLVDLAYCAIKSTGTNITKEIIIDAIDDDPTLLNTLNEKVSEDMAAFEGLEKEAKK